MTRTYPSSTWILCYGRGVRLRRRGEEAGALTWKFHGSDMEGSSTGSGAWAESEVLEEGALEKPESAVLGVFGRLLKEGSLKRRLRELTGPGSG